jgi:ubiquinone/menaquinone biosynthesis C-methylase UbiE
MLAMRRLSHETELLDGPLEDRSALRASLRDLGRVNRWLGGAALSRSALIRLATGAHYGPRVGRHPWRERPLRLLDVVTGGADIPASLLDWAEQRGIGLEVVAIDSRPEIVDVALERSARRRGLHVRVADALALPYPDNAFEVAHTSLTTHHFEPDELVRCLEELRRVSRLGVIVNDLDRNRVAWLGAWVLSHLFTRSPLTRHDAAVSVKRAYRPSEIARLAAEAGLVEAARIRGFVGYRYALAFVSAGPPEQLTSADAPRPDARAR